DRAVVTETGAGGIGCNKFYETYGKRGQTGGLMAAWCPHCVCLGFHCIPKGEGRNDVFSALFTRWKKPPKVVIYDFACALGPYCMMREPEFFGETRFLIDGFHAKGHTRCTKACFISAYKKNSPALADVNSSAAECGDPYLFVRGTRAHVRNTRALLVRKLSSLVRKVFSLVRTVFSLVRKAFPLVRKILSLVCNILSLVCNI
ncbi:hypothetical protein EXIGLDRAFT_770508, partial [Exidia glandulosa HHB12029]